MKSKIIVREARVNDASSVLGLMRKLAEFEGYLDQFAVDETALVNRAFERKLLEILVAENSNKELVGMLVYYFLPFTYDLTPWLFIKELYVEPKFRGRAIGELLMQRAAHVCQRHGGKKMVWSVLSDNIRAQQFYQRLGAQHDVAWLPYSLDTNALKTLADREAVSDSNKP